MELTSPVLALLQEFAPVFTTPTFTTFFSAGRGENRSGLESPTLRRLQHRPLVGISPARSFAVHPQICET